MSKVRVWFSGAGFGGHQFRYEDVDTEKGERSIALPFCSIQVFRGLLDAAEAEGFAAVAIQTAPPGLALMSLLDAVKLYMLHTGADSFVIPDVLDGKTLAFGAPEFVKEHVCGLLGE